ncbi:MAG TPA: PaaI family thioesterase [Bacteriovoracaceae bacterium]|nr:PaaI family thioesterase [Bacteriovoracaceae bacterium]
MNPIDMPKFIELFKSINKYDQSNGLNFEIPSPGTVIYKMKIADQHLSVAEVAHGACIAGFMDCVLGLAALSEAVTRGSLTATVEFKINFIRPAKLGEELIGTGKVVHKGKSLLISSGEIRTAAGDLVAMGQGTFNNYPMNKKDFLNEYFANG